MAQLNDLIVNGYSRFLNSAYGNLNGSATSALCAAYAASTNTAIKVNSATSATCAYDVINKAINVNSAGSASKAASATSALSAGSAAKAAELTNKAIKVNSAGSADYATSAGSAPFISHNHNYHLSGNGTAVNVSAGVNFKPSGSNIKFYVSGNDIYISAKNDNTTYTSLNSINSTEYNALTSTSANKRNPNDHQLSSHTNFSTYFNGTSAKSALTSKSALSAGSAQKSYSSYWSKADDNTDLDRVIGCGVAGGSASWNAGSEFYGTVTYDTAFTFNSKSNTMKVINVSATSITGVTISGTNIIGDKGKFLSAEATTAIFNNTSSINLSGTNITATTFSGNLSGWSRSALTASYATKASQDSDGSAINSVYAKIKGTYTASDQMKVYSARIADRADKVDGLHFVTGSIGTASDTIYFC